MTKLSPRETAQLKKARAWRKGIPWRTPRQRSMTAEKTAEERESAVDTAEKAAEREGITKLGFKGLGLGLGFLRW